MDDSIVNFGDVTFTLPKNAPGFRWHFEPIGCCFEGGRALCGKSYTSLGDTIELLRVSCPACRAALADREIRKIAEEG
jgi:hypothetical protein